MIEKLGITPETHGYIYCEMLEALIDTARLDDSEGYENLKVIQAIENASGYTWNRLQTIIREGNNE